MDGHERPATVTYCKIFVTRYLTHELRTHQWIQISNSELIQLEGGGIIAKGSGCQYTINGEVMVEHHIYTKMNWTIPDVEIALVPKADGQGVIISAL